MFSKIPPMKAEIPPKRHLVFQVKCPELSSYSKKTCAEKCDLWGNNCIRRMEAEIPTRKYLVPQVRFLSFLTDRSQTYVVCSVCVVSATTGVPEESQIQTRRYNVLQVKYSSLLTDRNHIYTVCAAYVEMATCPTSSLDRHGEVLRSTSIVPFNTDRTQPSVHYLHCMRGR